MRLCCQESVVNKKEFQERTFPSMSAIGCYRMTVTLRLNGKGGRMGCCVVCVRNNREPNSLKIFLFAVCLSWMNVLSQQIDDLNDSWLVIGCRLRKCV